jgi:hypothetical protein
MYVSFPVSLQARQGHYQNLPPKLLKLVQVKIIQRSVSYLYCFSRKHLPLLLILLYLFSYWIYGKIIAKPTAKLILNTYPYEY